MQSVPSIKPKPAPEVHPEGVFAAKLVAWGEIRLSQSGRARFIVPAKFETANGIIFVHMVGFLETLRMLVNTPPLEKYNVLVHHVDNPFGGKHAHGTVIWE